MTRPTYYYILRTYFKDISRCKTPYSYKEVVALKSRYLALITDPNGPSTGLSRRILGYKMSATVFKILRYFPDVKAAERAYSRRKLINKESIISAASKSKHLTKVNLESLNCDKRIKSGKYRMDSSRKGLSQRSYQKR